MTYDIPEAEIEKWRKIDPEQIWFCDKCKGYHTPDWNCLKAGILHIPSFGSKKIGEIREEDLSEIANFCEEFKNEINKGASVGVLRKTDDGTYIRKFV